MRRILTLAVLALACAGCNSGSQDGATGPRACPSRITWNGTVYYGAKFSARRPATLVLGTGGRPTCGDVNGGEAGASSTVEVRRLAGVDPSVAVAVRGEPNVAYLARAYAVGRLRKLVPRLIAPA